jgi:hypothetical protein
MCLIKFLLPKQNEQIERVYECTKEDWVTPVL